MALRTNKIEFDKGKKSFSVPNGQSRLNRARSLTQPMMPWNSRSRRWRWIGHGGHREWIGGATANFCIWNYMLMMIWVPVVRLWSLEKPSGVSARNSHSMKTSAPVDLVFPTIWITYVQKCVYNKCKKSRNFRYDQMNDICWYRYVFSM